MAEVKLSTTDARFAYVEDKASDRMGAIDMFQRHILCPLHCYPSVEEFWDSVENGPLGVPDVLLTDLGLAGPMHGLDLIRMVKADRRFDMTPVIAITFGAYSAKSAMQAGADGYIVKPMTVELLTFVLRDLRRYRFGVKVVRTTDQVGRTDETGGGADR